MVEFKIIPNNINSFNPRTKELTKWIEYSPSIRFFKEGDFFSIDVDTISKTLDIDVNALEQVIEDNDGFVLEYLPMKAKICRIKSQEGSYRLLNEIYRLCSLSKNNENLLLDGDILVIDKKKDLYTSDFSNVDGYKFSINILTNKLKYNSQYTSDWYGLPLSLYQELVSKHNGAIETIVFNGRNEITFKSLQNARNFRDELNKLCLMCIVGDAKFKYIDGKAQIIL